MIDSVKLAYDNNSFNELMVIEINYILILIKKKKE